VDKFELTLVINGGEKKNHAALEAHVFDRICVFL